jgi:hypothetical protein
VRVRHHHLVAGALTPLALLALATPAIADGSSIATLRRQADAWSSGPLVAFLQAKAAQPAPFDWSDDGCSVVPDRPLGFDFHAACQRHDFGYRNFGQGLMLDPSPARRASVDRRFRSDLDAVCGRERLLIRRRACGALALTYFEGVRLLGARAFSG